MSHFLLTYYACLVTTKERHYTRDVQTIFHLYNDAPLRLHQAGVGGKNHFFAVAAKAMRHVLVDYHDPHRAAKRGADQEIIPLDEGRLPSPDRIGELVALDDALTAYGPKTGSA
jgi:hypothetical protein